ncbi:MAG: hypothetical protein KJO07_17065 [Deltaproteobacteria bacterium]|jgi:hypothetical protein|nr:hypothetical protein [Deltaproteobacteria bacterium]
MKSNVLSNALTKNGKFQDKDGVLSASNMPATLYVAIGNTMLTIEKVRSVRLADDAVTIETRSETFVLAHEDVRAVRIENSSPRAGLTP